MVLANDYFKINVFNLEKLLFYHAAKSNLICCHQQLKRIQYFDAMGSSGKKYTSAVRRYLIDEMRDKLNIDPSQETIDEWVELQTPAGTP